MGAGAQPRLMGNRRSGKQVGERRACGDMACAHPRGCGAVSVVAEGVPGAQAMTHGGKRDILAQLCLGLEGRRLRGSKEHFMF